VVRSGKQVEIGETLFIFRERAQPAQDLRSIVQSRDTAPRLLMLALAAVTAAIIAACATTVQQEIANEPPTSVETLSYYPFQVRGYQNSYPRRRVLVLMPLDARDFKDVAGQTHERANGTPAIGVMLYPGGGVVQRIYSSQLGPVVQSALVRSADEAGMLATASNDTLEAALKETNEDYVLASRIARCWVDKHSAPDAGSSSNLGWFTTADVALDLTIYKPPFNVAFWQGKSAATYSDPPADNGSGLGDDVSIYDLPGQVLSVALTRSVAGGFKREALRSLIVQDSMPPR
jgi:hypothetical protein